MNSKIMTANRLTTTPPPPFSRPRFITITALILTLALALASCGESGGEDSNSGGAPQTVSYSGMSGDKTYTLEITEKTGRYAAQAGDTYKLTVDTKISTGTVSAVGTVLTLSPSVSVTATFTVTVSAGGSITAMEGTITFTDNTTESAPATLTPRSALTINNVVGNTTVKITKTTITGSTDFDSLADVVATGQGSYPYLTWKEGVSLNGTYNVMLRLVPEYNSGLKTVKYKNNVTFTDGSATVDWNSL